ncbi:hypothetical protein BH09SUM1_BH09SUM1_12850 [soil metagenome]
MTNESRWDRNRRHWQETLDAQNLAAAAQPLPIEKQIALYWTADVREALVALEPLNGALTLDLGGGLGLMAAILARGGAEVVIADVSLPRLQEAHRMMEQLGLRDRVRLVCCAAEHMPFADGAFDREFTKSVLIHTQLKETAAELNRTLSPSGRAVFIEPMDRNPFVNLYRRLAAPRIWQTITDYFTPGMLDTLSAPFRASRGVETSYSFFMTFFATPFNYQLHWPAVYRFAEAAFLLLDRGLFALMPSLRGRCWFCLLKITPAAPTSRPGN